MATGAEFLVECTEGETILEALRRNNLPVMGSLLLDEEGKFISVSYQLCCGDEVWAYALRNPDYRALLPEYRVVVEPDAVTEIVRPLDSSQVLGLVQFSREAAIEYIYDAFSRVLLDYSVRDKSPIQVALSGGGDGRVLAECVSRFASEHSDATFHAVIVAVGFEDEEEHLRRSVAIAERFGLDYTVLNTREAADLLGFGRDLNDVIEQYRQDFPSDELEVLGTYWVQEVNTHIAARAGRRAILMGYNQEDVVAERLFQAMSGELLPPYPVRSVGEFDIIAPLCRVPKKMLDAMDLENSLRNYEFRVPSVSYLRSSLYFVAHMISERFPLLADALSSGGLVGDGGEALRDWLREA